MKNLDSIIPISDEGLYPIRSVSEMSGVNSITLRAWERRYGLFEPKRTPKGHRLYSEQDVVRIQQVLELLSKGVAIGRVAKVLKDQQSATDLSKTVAPELAKNKKPTNKEWNKHQEKLLNKIQTYDILQLEIFHHELLSIHAIEIITENLIRPALDNLKSASGDYQFYKIFLLHRIGGLFLRTSIRNSGSKILLIGLDDRSNDIGLLLFSLPLMKQGYKVINLGTDISLEAIPSAVTASNADCLLLFSDSKSINCDFNSLENLAKEINTPIFIDCPDSKQYEKDLKKAGLILLPSKYKKQISLIENILNKVIK